PPSGPRAKSPPASQRYLADGDGAMLVKHRLELPVVESRIARLDAQEDAILRSALEPRRVEDRMIELRETAEGEKGSEADIDGKSAQISQATGMKAGQLFNGRPPILIG